MFTSVLSCFLEHPGTYVSIHSMQTGSVQQSEYKPTFVYNWSHREGKRNREAWNSGTVLVLFDRSGRHRACYWGKYIISHSDNEHKSLPRGFV